MRKLNTLPNRFLYHQDYFFLIDHLESSETGNQQRSLKINMKVLDSPNVGI